MSEEPVVVYESQGPLGAEVALAKLRSEGIQAMLRYEAVGRVLGLTIDGLGLVQVLVNPADVGRAAELLEEIQPGCEGADTSDEACVDDDPPEDVACDAAGEPEA
jgi:hypothetical protein